MARFTLTILFVLLFSIEVSSAVKRSNSSSSKVEEKNAKNVQSCQHLGKAETSKNAGTGFSYNLKAAKKNLAEKVSELGGDTFVLENAWDSGQNRTVTFVADVYKCD